MFGFLGVARKIEDYTKSYEPDVFHMENEREVKVTRMVKLKYSGHDVKCYDTLLGMHFFFPLLVF